jgi:hypothetical protein
MSVTRKALGETGRKPPSVTAYGFNPGMLSDRPRGPIWRRDAETLTKMAALSAGSNGVTLSRKERLPSWNGRENDWRATRVL